MTTSYSQVKTNFRTAITIPEKSWGRFRDIFDEYVEKMKEAEDGKEVNSQWGLAGWDRKIEDRLEGTVAKNKSTFEARRVFTDFSP